LDRQYYLPLMDQLGYDAVNLEKTLEVREEGGREGGREGARAGVWAGSTTFR